MDLQDCTNDNIYVMTDIRNGEKPIFRPYNLFCKVCVYHAQDEKTMYIHKLSKSHVKKERGEFIYKYNCEVCNFHCNFTRDINKHLDSKSHCLKSGICRRCKLLNRDQKNNIINYIIDLKDNEYI